jgi:hypothetical protein
MVGARTMAAEVTQAPAASAAELYTQKDTRDVVALVEAAANEVRLHGRDAFASFRVKGSRWFQGDRYVFVLATDGNSVVYPPDPESASPLVASFWKWPTVQRQGAGSTINGVNQIAPTAVQSGNPPI